MLKPKVLLILPVLVLLLGVVALALNRTNEPHYAHRSLSYWVADPDSAQSRAAVQAMGTNVIPTLLTWAAQEPAAWKRTLINFPLIRHTPGAVDFLVGPAQIRAANGFLLLGTNAAPAIPALVTLMKDTNRPICAKGAIDALAAMGEPGLQTLGQALANTNQQNRLYILLSLMPWEENRVRPFLCAVTNDPDPSIRKTAMELVVFNDLSHTNTPRQ